MSEMPEKNDEKFGGEDNEGAAGTTIIANNEYRFTFPWHRMRAVITGLAWVEQRPNQKWFLLREMNNLSNVASLIYIYPNEGLIELVYMRFMDNSYFVQTEGEFITIANFDGLMAECPFYHEQRLSNSLL